MRSGVLIGMKLHLFALLFLIGCATAPPVKPVVPAPSPVVQVPAQETPAKEMPKVELPEDTEGRAELWLTLLRSQLGLPLEQVYFVCVAMGSDLTYVETNQHGNWFMCGQDDGGYTVVVDDDGKTIYVADGNFPFTLKGLTDLLGKPVARQVGSLTQYKWVVTDGKFTRIVALNVIEEDGESVSFVSTHAPEVDFLGLVGEVSDDSEPAPIPGTLNL